MADLSPQSVTAVETEAATQPILGIARRLAQSFAVYESANFGIRAINFLLIVVYAHYLRPYDYGIIYLAETIAFLISLMAFSANLALNFAMIPRWGMYGAAWATTIAYAVEALGAFTLAQSFFSLSSLLLAIL